MAAPDFGLEALYRLHPVNSKTNAVIVLVHFVLTKNGLLHVGRGIYWENDEIGSEMLPADWEQSDREYRYVSRADPKKRFILTFSGPETVLLVRMVHVKQKVTTSICVDTEKHVDGTQLASNTPRLIFPKLFDLMAQISNELLDEHQAATCSIGTSAPSSNPRGPSYEPGGPPNISRNPDINPLFHEEVPLGRRDLDPFLGPGPGGGNIVDPLQGLRDNRFSGPTPLGPDGIPLPREAVPPGARFDPIFPEGAVRPDLGVNPDIGPDLPYQSRFRLPRGDDPYGPPGGNFGGFI